jgi:hypothetical protein
LLAEPEPLRDLPEAQVSVLVLPVLEYVCLVDQSLEVPVHGRKLVIQVVQELLSQVAIHLLLDLGRSLSEVLAELEQELDPLASGVHKQKVEGAIELFHGRLPVVVLDPGQQQVVATNRILPKPVLLNYLLDRGCF